MNKLLIICGATATGKTDLGISLAQKFNGEIVSADSRHIYKGMDIGTGKDIPQESEPLTDHPLDEKFKKINKNFSAVYRLRNAIPIWLIDAVNPDYRFNLADYFRLTRLVIKDICQRNRLPVVVGGTGLYIKALITQLHLINIPPDIKLRNKLSRLTLSDLQQSLQKINPEKWKIMNESDRQNGRRLVRAIEIAQCKNNHLIGQLSADWRMLYLYSDLPSLYKKIDDRVEKRVKQGIVNEIRILLGRGYSFDLPSFSAIPYRLFKSYFIGAQSEQELHKIIDRWKYEEHALARRQITWFKKMVKQYNPEQIFEVDVTSISPNQKIGKQVAKWYTKKNNA